VVSCDIDTALRACLSQPHSSIKTPPPYFLWPKAHFHSHFLFLLTRLTHCVPVSSSISSSEIRQSRK
jgi:hypothetical protein